MRLYCISFVVVVAARARRRGVVAGVSLDSSSALLIKEKWENLPKTTVENAISITPIPWDLPKQNGHLLLYYILQALIGVWSQSYVIKSPP